MIRYKCPTCSAGRLAPASMHADDMRRFCVDCSVSSGKLVRVVSVAKTTAAAKKAAERLARREKEKVENAKAIARAREEMRCWPWVLNKRWTKLNREAGGPGTAVDWQSLKLPDRSATYASQLRHAAFVSLWGPNGKQGNATDQRKHDATRKLLRDQADKRPWLPTPVIKIDPTEGGPEIERYIRMFLGPTYLAEDLGADPQSEIGMAIAAAAQHGAWATCDELGATARAEKAPKKK